MYWGTVQLYTGPGTPASRGVGGGADTGVGVAGLTASPGLGLT